MSVVQNFTGRALGLLRRCVVGLESLCKISVHGITLLFGAGVGALAAAFYWCAVTAIDSFFEAEIMLNTAFNNAFAGQVTSASIGELLGYANYYFPLDVIGSLSVVYMTLWVTVYAYKNCKEIANNIDTFKGIFTK